MRLTFAAKSAAEEATQVSSARLLDRVERQRFAEDLHEALDGAFDERMTLSVVGRAMEQLSLGGVAEMLLADSSTRARPSLRVHQRRTRVRRRITERLPRGATRSSTHVLVERRTARVPVPRAASAGRCRRPACRCCSTGAVSACCTRLVPMARPRPRWRPRACAPSPTTARCASGRCA